MKALHILVHPHGNHTALVGVRDHKGRHAETVVALEASERKAADMDTVDTLAARLAAEMLPGHSIINVCKHPSNEMLNDAVVRLLTCMGVVGHPKIQTIHRDAGDGPSWPSGAGVTMSDVTLAFDLHLRRQQTLLGERGGGGMRLALQYMEDDLASGTVLVPSNTALAAKINDVPASAAPAGPKRSRAVRRREARKAHKARHHANTQQHK